jgi:uncharacterized protein (TIGR04255 family)
MDASFITPYRTQNSIESMGFFIFFSDDASVDETKLLSLRDDTDIKSIFELIDFESKADDNSIVRMERFGESNKPEWVVKINSNSICFFNNQYNRWKYAKQFIFKITECLCKYVNNCSVDQLLIGYNDIFYVNNFDAKNGFDKNIICKKSDYIPKLFFESLFSSYGLRFLESEGDDEHFVIYNIKGSFFPELNEGFPARAIFNSDMSGNLLFDKVVFQEFVAGLSGAYAPLIDATHNKLKVLFSSILNDELLDKVGMGESI